MERWWRWGALLVGLALMVYMDGLNLRLLFWVITSIVVGRAFNTFPLIGFLNRRRKEPIAFEEQVRRWRHGWLLVPWLTAVASVGCRCHGWLSVPLLAAVATVGYGPPRGSLLAKRMLHRQRIASPCYLTGASSTAPLPPCPRL